MDAWVAVLSIYLSVYLHIAWRHQEEAVPHRGGQVPPPCHATSPGLADVRQVRIPIDPPVRLALPPQTKGARAADSLGAARLGVGGHRVSSLGRGGAGALASASHWALSGTAAPLECGAMHTHSQPCQPQEAGAASRGAPESGLSAMRRMPPGRMSCAPPPTARGDGRSRTHLGHGRQDYCY